MTTSSGLTDDDVNNGSDDDGDLVYAMNSDPKGICVIINNKNFHNSNSSAHLPVREGTDYDRDNLRIVFEGLGFDVQCHNDLTDVQMTHLMYDMAKFDHFVYDCFVCCILSHGCLGKVYGSNGELVEIKHLIAAMKPSSCPSLTGKPKLFFLQACQGKETQVGFPTMERDAGPTEEVLVPNEGDFLVSYSTVPGFECYRDPSSGSVYVKKLTELLRKHSAEKSILDILTKLNYEVGREHNTISDGHDYRQMPEPRYTLRKKLVFGPGNFTTSAAQQESLATSGSPSTVVVDSSTRLSTGKAVERRGAESLKGQSPGTHRAAKKYVVEVFTRNISEAGTNANVFLKMYGNRGESKEEKLRQSETNKDKFERGKRDRFFVEVADLGTLYMVRIRHDNSGMGPAWYLDRVEITDPTDKQKYIFYCERWLATRKEDGKIERTLYVKGYDGEMSWRSSISSVDTMYEQGAAKESMASYEVTVSTGDVPEAGTDAKISLTLFGTKGSTAPIELEKEEFRFERASTNRIAVKMRDVAPLKKLRVIVEPKSSARKSWYLKEIQVQNVGTRTLSVFQYNGWLGKGKEGTQTSVDMPAIENGEKVIDETEYKISVKTSDVRGAGTDASVYVVLFGVNGDSGELHLKVSETNDDPFETGQWDVFTMKGILSLGELSKLRVWHDNRGFGAAWHLAHVEVEDLSTHEVWTFPCNCWLSKKNDEKQSVRELTCATAVRPAVARVKYEVMVHTGDVEGAGTDANMSINIFGVNGDTGKRPLKQRHRNLFEQGQVDKFTLEAVDLGKLTKVHVEHDNSGLCPGWFLNRVEIFNTSTNATDVFPCHKWFDRDKGDGEIARDVFPQSHEWAETTELPLRL